MTQRGFTPIWEFYGLRSNPFVVSPLPLKGGNLPIEKAFFGREEEIKRLKNYFASGDSRIIVCGEPGVGKTSFVNYVRRSASKAGFFTNFKEIDIQPGWKKEQFIVNALVSMHSTIRILGLTDRLQTITKKLEVLFTLIDNENQNYSIALAGIGGGYGSSRTVSKPQMSETYLSELFSETIAALIKAGYKGVILHFNNLTVNDTEGFSEKQLGILFNNIRDVLLTENTHFVFVTDLTVPPVIEKQPRVASIMRGAPIVINPMSWKEIKTIIHKRFELLKERELGFTLPVEEDAVKVLYDLYSGNIRYILNSLSEALTSLSSESRPITINKGQLARILNTLARERFLEKLSKREREVLFAMLDEKESTNKSISEKIGLKSQNVSSYLKKLQGTGCIYIYEARGTSKYYRVSEYAKWLLIDSEQKGGGTLRKWV